MLTGTPIQNNMAELHTLMNFLNPTEFSHEFFQAINKNLTSEAAQVQELHKIIQPYWLRCVCFRVEFGQC
jgi:SNF2 family DNA or RNA helicase